MNKIITLALILINISAFSQQITGKICDKYSKKSIAGVVVELPELNKGTATNDEGEFVITNIPNGNFKVQISFAGYETKILNTNNLASEIYLEPTLIETEKVVVSGGIFSSAHTNAVKVDVVKINSMPQTTNITGFLTNVAGVDLISQGQGITKPVIRGLSGTNILVLKNGFRLQNYQFSEAHPFLIDAVGTDRVEVIKGPASLLYGSDAIGGVLNVIPEKPAQVNNFEGDYNFSFSSNSKGIMQNLGIKSSTKKLMWGTRIGQNSNQDFMAGNNVIVKNSRFNRYVFNNFLIFNTKSAIFRLSYQFTKSKFGIPNLPAANLISENSYNNNVWYQNLDNHFATLKTTFFLNKVKLKTNLSYENNKRALNINDSIIAVDMFLQTLSYETKTEYSNQKLVFEGGVQGYVSVNKNISGAKNEILPDYTKNTNAIFSLVKYEIFNDFNLQGGVRYEKSMVYIPKQDYKDMFSADTTFNFSNFSGSLGATYNPFKVLNLRMNLASAYRMPNMAELTQNGLHGVRYEVGNFDLKSQRSYEADVSAHLHSKILFFDISFFYNDIKNYIFLSPTNDTSTGGFNIYKYVQNDATLYGFETGLDFFPVSKLDLKATYNFIIGKQNDEYLPFIPQNKLRFNAKYSFGDVSSFINDLEINSSFLYAFAQNNVSIDEQISPNYWLLNANVNFKIPINKYNIGFQFSANNILNQIYVDHLSELKENGYFDLGRNIMAGLKFEF